MNAKTSTRIITIVTALTVSILAVANAKTETDGGTDGLFYSNSAYTLAIPFAPKPVADVHLPDAKIVYVDVGHGQAIYSYPNNLAFQEVAFNVEYVDNAHGQAIYSYPNNNTKHHLELADKTENLDNKNIVPVSYKGHPTLGKAAESGRQF